MSLADVVAAAKEYDAAVRGKAQELAGVLLSVRQPEEEDQTVLEQLLAASPAPAVGLYALLKEGLDIRGVEVDKRLEGLRPFLVEQLEGDGDAAPFTRADLSTALLALVATLPDTIEDVPKAPVMVAGLIGHLLGAGHLTFGLAELASAVREAGAEDAAEAAAAEGEEEGEDPPLVDAEKAAPMLLAAANAARDASDEAAARKLWQEASVDLAGLLPSFARDEEGAVAKLVAKYGAEYLTTTSAEAGAAGS